MADKLYGMTEQDHRIFRDMVAEHQRLRANGSQVGQGGGIDEGFQASDVYIARTPSGGIPGLEEFPGTAPDEPGSALCQVYKLGQVQGVGDFKLLKISGLTKRVFNLNTNTVAGSAWIPIWKTKGGVWITSGNSESITDDDTGTGTGTDGPEDSPGGGQCELARLKPDDCLLATGPNGSVVMRPGGLGWVSDSCLRYLGSLCGVVEFWFADGQLHLSVDGLELLNCGNGCFTGGPLTGHVRPGTDTSEPCDGEVFTVCVSCHCCIPTGYYGEGWYCVATGTGTGTTAADCEPLYLTDDDVCSVDLICGGPYTTFAEAEAVCGEEGGGDEIPDTGVGPTDCPPEGSSLTPGTFGMFDPPDFTGLGSLLIASGYSYEVSPNTTYRFVGHATILNGSATCFLRGGVDSHPSTTVELGIGGFTGPEEITFCHEFTTGAVEDTVCVAWSINFAGCDGCICTNVKAVFSILEGPCP